MLDFEPLCLSAQPVISLSVKTMLKHVGSALFLLKSAVLLSVESFGCWVSHVRVGVLVFEGLYVQSESGWVGFSGV
jgi:hypothetical protein